MCPSLKNGYRNMSIEQIIQKAFPAVNQDEITDSYIIANQNLMDLEGKIDFLLYVPVYMLWCVRNKDNYDQLVTDRTIYSIAEFGRSKEQNSFKCCCNLKQKFAVVAFLQWCRKNLVVVHEEQIDRSIKRWKSAASVGWVRQAKLGMSCRVQVPVR
jgi:hypothetical protein